MPVTGLMHARSNEAVKRFNKPSISIVDLLIEAEYKRLVQGDNGWQFHNIRRRDLMLFQEIGFVPEKTDLKWNNSWRIWAETSVTLIKVRYWAELTIRSAIQWCGGQKIFCSLFGIRYSQTNWRYRGIEQRSYKRCSNTHETNHSRRRVYIYDDTLVWLRKNQGQH